MQQQQQNINQAQPHSANPLMMDNNNGGGVGVNSGGVGVASVGAEEMNNNPTLEQANNSGTQGGSDTYASGGELEQEQEQEQDPNRLILNWGLVFTYFR